MEKCEGTAYSWLLNNGQNDTEFLDFLRAGCSRSKEVATLRLDSNHRDLHSGNIMYKSVATRGERGKFIMKKKFLLVDFGFSCASINGTRYEGTQYFVPGQKCFRASRDLALPHLQNEQRGWLKHKMKQFIKTLLTFTYKNRVW
jgi:hypothetical protein